MNMFSSFTLLIIFMFFFFNELSVIQKSKLIQQTQTHMQHT